MPSYTSAAVFGLAAFGVAANAACLTDAEAQQVATNYGDLIATYTSDLADVALAPNFTDYSESVNSLINGCPQGAAAMTLPLLAPTFTSREMFKTGQGQQPPINFQQLNVFHSCDTVIIRWMTTNTAPIPDPKPVVGIITASVIPAPAGNKYPYIIDNVYSEFDAAAWLQNLNDAGICTGPTGLPTAGNSTAPTTVTVVPAGCTAAPPAGGSGVAAPTGASPYGNGTSTYAAPTGAASNPPAYTGPAYTGAASSLKSSFAGLAAIAAGAVVYLN